MTQNELKKAVGEFALRYVKPGMVVGVGTGSTTSYFIDALASMKDQIEGAVSSSNVSSEKMRALNINILDSNTIDAIDIYIDGADEVNPLLHLIKGGGAALTGEKILTAMSKQFICIVDETKQVPYLGHFPLPVEVIPMARSYVARELVKLQGRPVYRSGVVTDHGNVILDVHNLKILNPVQLEETINQIPGVVTVGLFAKRPADILVVGNAQGVNVIQN